MIKFLKDRILPLFMIAWLGGLLPACVYDEEDAATGSEKTDGFNISIAISAGEASTARAYDGNLPSEGGIGAENYININDLQIYAFSTDGNTLLAQVYPKPADSDVAMDPSVVQIGNMYYLKAELSYDIFSENPKFKLVAVANGNTTDTNDWDSLMGATYSYTVTDNTSWIPQWEESGIPMFGVQEVNLSGYNFKTNNEFNSYTLNNVNMLRAMAKIEVINAIKPETTITSVKLTLGYNTQGLIAPTGASMMKTTEDVIEANIPTLSEEQRTTELFFFGEGVIGKFVAYVPEFALNADNRKDAITIAIDDVEYKLSLAPYDNNNLPDINNSGYPWNALLRNHIYRYTIVGVEEPHTVNVNYMVCPWNEESGDISFD